MRMENNSTKTNQISRSCGRFVTKFIEFVLDNLSKCSLKTKRKYAVGSRCDELKIEVNEYEKW